MRENYMAVINPRQELEKQYQSLSDRLNQLDQVSGQVDPVVAEKMLDFSNLPVGYNPMNDIRGFLEYNERSRGIRSGVADQQQGMLDALLRLSESDKDRALQEKKMTGSGDDFLTELKKAAALQDIKSGKLKLNMKTGELESVEDNTEKEVAKEKAELKSLTEELLNTDTGSITGRIREGLWLKDPVSLSKQAKLDRLISMLSLENRKKLKGSGQISDFESKMLEKSVGALQQGIGDKELKEELKRIYKNLGGETAKKDKKADPLGIL